MPLQVVGDDRNEFPAALLPHVKDVGAGKFAVMVGTAGHNLTDDTALRNALAQEREGRRAIAGHLRGYGWEGPDENLARGAQAIDPNTAREDRAKVAGGQVPANSKDFEVKLQESIAPIKEKLRLDREAFELDRRSFDTQVSEQLIVREAEAAVKAAGGNEASLALLLPTIRLRAKVVKSQDGKFVARAHDEQGREMISRRTGSTEPMLIPEFVAMLKANPLYAAAFPLKAPGGSGSDHSIGGSVASGEPDLARANGRQLLEHANRR